MSPYAETLARVTRFFGDEAKARLWMQTPNPMLGNVSPASMIAAGRHQKLRRFINHALAESLPCQHEPSDQT